MKKLLLEKHPRRFYRRQKERFKLDLTKELRKHGYEVKEQKSLLGKNIMFGNENAPKVLMAHYDTATNMGLLYPFIKLLGLYYANVAIIIVMLWWLVVGYANLILIFTGIMFVGLLIPNRYNYNDNSSGVIALLIHAINNQDNSDYLYILTDNEEKGLFGAIALKRYLKKNKLLANKQFINIDCVAHGDELVIASSTNSSFINIVHKKLTGKYQYTTKIGKIISSDHLVFGKQAIMITRVNRALIKKDMYIEHIHTNRDKYFNDSLVENAYNIIDEIWK